jgi:uncharacterized UPF0160 family protein
MTDYIVTHDGQAHADDLFAYTVLKRLFPALFLVRTRDKEKIASAHIAFDVGMEYDHSRYRYDHHQNDKPLRESGIPYSAFGLIWKHYGKQYLETLLSNTDRLPEVWGAVDNGLVRHIDIGDNGYVCDETKAVMHEFNITRAVGNGAKDLGGFLRIVNHFTTQWFEAYCTKIAEEMQDLQYVKERLTQHLGEIFTVEENSMINPTNAIDFFVDHQEYGVKFVVYPRGKGMWAVNNIRKSRDTFEASAYLPKEYGGLSGSDLKKHDPDLEFVHSGLFFAVGRTFESVYSLAVGGL